MKYSLLFFSFLFLIACENSPKEDTPIVNSTPNDTVVPEDEAEESPVNVMDSIPYELIKLTDKSVSCDDDNAETPCGEISVSYPVFDKAFALFNDSIRPSEDPKVAMKSFIEEFDKAKADSDYMSDWYLNDYTNVITNNRLLVTLNNNEDTYQGGAHGNYACHYYHYNPETGELYELKDWFSAENIEKLTQIGERYFRKAHELGENDSFEEAGLWFKEEQFYLSPNFFLDKENNLNFFYNVYEIGPYVAGSFEFAIPKADFIDLCKENSVLKKIVQ